MIAVVMVMMVVSPGLPIARVVGLGIHYLRLRIDHLWLCIHHLRLDHDDRCSVDNHRLRSHHDRHRDPKPNGHTEIARVCREWQGQGGKTEETHHTTRP